MDGFSEQGQYGDDTMHYNDQEFHKEFEQREQQHDSELGFAMRDSIGGHRDSASGKLFVGGVAWETTEESFSDYFSKYGEIIDSVIMIDKHSGRPRGFGFVTFADPAVADKVLEEDHVLDSRAVEVKRTVPREDMEVRGIIKTKKIFVGGLPASLTNDELREYFSLYGSIVDYQIMLDYKTGRSRGFGFITFENEDAVEKIFLEGKIHELGGKQVEIKRAEPRKGGDYNGNAVKSHGGFDSAAGRYGGYNSGNWYNGKMGRGYDGYSAYDVYGNYVGDYGGSYVGFYGGYPYGFGYGGTMYGSAGFGGNGYGIPGGYIGVTAYGGNNGRGYGNGFVDHNSGAGNGGYDTGKGYDRSDVYMNGRYHPYLK
ncbi:hypothetical protein FEM48_Zijuj01G0279400 [Ziziphus jujuba var. spinosa]|uniref:RRM domain-containing protein n=1 Tax=Ziziphus jujuba var. spinosa TaxID=714518 RepID=A0A978W5C1_ZIZJJ|nr:hypothetical protein FEM48_Zijuj01G0279400 [Ziziphus jujuba var. spinosa]